MAYLKKENENITFLLTGIDTFSKYAWVKPLKRKTSGEIVRAFQDILLERRPHKVRSDKGSEFMNKDFEELLKKENIGFYTANNEVKAAIVERFNRMLKGRMYRYFTARNTLRYINNLQDFVHSYNNTYHQSIGVRPSAVNKSNANIVREKLFGKQMRRRQVNFRVGDYVRLSLKKKLFKKGYLQHYTEEIFKISKVFKERLPTMYEVEDLKGKKVSDDFYKEELCDESVRSIPIICGHHDSLSPFISVLCKFYQPMNVVLHNFFHVVDPLLPRSSSASMSLHHSKHH
eukprot:gene17153-biopygen14759